MTIPHPPESGQEAVAKPEPDPLVEEARVMVELTTKAQGLPFYIEDPAILRRIAQLTSQPADPRDD